MYKKTLTFVIIITPLFFVSCKKAKQEALEVYTDKKSNPNSFEIEAVASTRYLHDFFDNEDLMRIESDGLESLVIDPVFNISQIPYGENSFSNQFYFYTEAKSKMIYKGSHLAIGIPYDHYNNLATTHDKLKFITCSAGEDSDPMKMLKIKHEQIKHGFFKESISLGHKSFTKDNVNWILVDISMEEDTGSYDITFLEEKAHIDEEDDTYSFDLINIKVSNMWYYYNKDRPDEIAICQDHPVMGSRSDKVLIKKGQLDLIDGLIRLIKQQIDLKSLIPPE